MRIHKLEFPKPILIIDDFLPEYAAEAVLQECIDLKPVYRPALVYNENNQKVSSPKHRQNDVVYLDDVYRGNIGASKIMANVLNNGLPDALAQFQNPPTHGVWCPEMRKLWQSESLIFDVINLSTRSETIVSRYGNCDFYGWHTDPNGNAANRLVTIAYYVNKRPEKFTGGEITFKANKKTIEVKPTHNRAVVFQSNILHKVNNVRLLDDAFEHGRFSLNLWFGFQA